MASNTSPGNKFKRPTNVEREDSSDLSDDTSNVGDSTGGKRMKKEQSSAVKEESELTENSDNTDQGPSTNEPADEIQEESQPTPVNCDYRTCKEVYNLLNIARNRRETAANAEPVGSSESAGPLDNDLSRMSVQSDSSLESDDDEVDDVKPKKDMKYFDPTPMTPKPKHNWNAFDVVHSRQHGISSKYSPDLFRYNCYGSLHMVERLELMYKMKHHDGCVNALNFNQYGTRLVSGSDDLHVIIWDWAISQPVLNYRSGHTSNVFQSKFVPLNNDTLIVTCARDGHVRLAELSPAGAMKYTKKLAQHKGSAHKLSVQHDSPHYILSCGEDATVFEIDLRQEKPNKLVTCKNHEKKVPLYSIFMNPQNSNEFAVAGRSQYVKVYDTRFLSQSDAVLKDYCPEHLVADDKLNITALVYNYNGQEILASYNDDDIYSFSTNETDTSKYLHRYRGHRNNQTVKGVNYFGPKSEYIMSGSDCGYVFFWEKESEHIINYMYGDEGGAVNCLESCPTMPVLATSGLDDDIKIWVPSCETPPDLSGLSRHLIRNMKQKEEEQNMDYPDTFADQTIWFLMRHLSRARRRSTGVENNSDSSLSSSDETEETTGPQCNQQ